MKRTSNKVVFIVFITVITLTIIIKLIDPSGNLFNTALVYGIYVVIGLSGLLALFGLLILIRVIWAAVSFRFRRNAEDVRPNFFEEMQSVLGNTLLPLGFDVRQENGRLRLVEFLRDEFILSISFDTMDEDYWVTAHSKPNNSYGQAVGKPDFAVECRDIRKADKFKSESIAKLNEWLIEKNIK